jgi:hypothetical protein
MFKFGKGIYNCFELKGIQIETERLLYNFFGMFNGLNLRMDMIREGNFLGGM